MNVLITGSVAFDYLMTFPGRFSDCIIPEKTETISLSFLVDGMRRVRGGIAVNIAYTMALLGGKPRIMATVGEDFGEYRAWLEERGIDTSLMKVVPGDFTSSFFATTDQVSAQIASFYPGAMSHAATQSLKDLAVKPDLVVISPTDPAAMTKFVGECRELGLRYLYDPSQQVLRLSGEELARDLRCAYFLFCNDYEYGIIRKKTGLTHEDILKEVKILVVTKGKEGATLYTEGQTLHIPTVPEDKIVDPTGVGDAFRGGFLTAFSRGWDLELCAKVGSLAAVYCLEKQGPQGQSYTAKDFVARFRKHFDDNGKLDALVASKK